MRDRKRERERERERERGRERAVEEEIDLGERVRDYGEVILFVDPNAVPCDSI